MNKYAIASLVALIVVLVAVIIAELILYRNYITYYRDRGCEGNWGSFWVSTANNIIQLFLAGALFVSQLVLC